MGSIVVQLGISPVKSHHYSQHAAALRTELGRTLSREQMLAFHEKDATRHALVAARQFTILALTTWALIAIANPLIWVPLAFVQGFTVFNFTVLLHENTPPKKFVASASASAASESGAPDARAQLSRSGAPGVGFLRASATTPSNHRYQFRFAG